MLPGKPDSIYQGHIPNAKLLFHFTYRSRNLKPYGKLCGETRQSRRSFVVFGFLERFGRPALELADRTHRSLPEKIFY